jgi:hypothetical protein
MLRGRRLRWKRTRGARMQPRLEPHELLGAIQVLDHTPAGSAWRRRRVQNGYVSSGTSGRARPPRELKNHSYPARTWPRVPASRRLSLTCPSLVMKGSPVRVRASASPDLQGLSSEQATPRPRVGYETGTSSDPFTGSEGVPPLGRFSLISRQFGRGAGSRWSHQSARKCPRVDARDTEPLPCCGRLPGESF